MKNFYIKKNKIKCIVPVHFAGAPANMKEIYKFSKKNKLNIIEDAAHALGGKYKNGKLWTIGELLTCNNVEEHLKY